MDNPFMNNYMHDLNELHAIKYAETALQKKSLETEELTTHFKFLQGTYRSKHKFEEMIRCARDFQQCTNASRSDIEQAKMCIVFALSQMDRHEEALKQAGGVQTSKIADESTSSILGAELELVKAVSYMGIKDYASAAGALAKAKEFLPYIKELGSRAEIERTIKDKEGDLTKKQNAINQIQPKFLTFMNNPEQYSFPDREVV